MAKAFFLADHASVESGKLYVNGGFWTHLGFAEYPATHPAFSVVTVLEVPWSQFDVEHHFSIWLEDFDGRPLGVDIEGDFRVDAANAARVGDPTLIPLAPVVYGVHFANPGDYTFVLRVNGEELARARCTATLRLP